MAHRRSFATSEGTREHFVAGLDDRIVGYAAIERRIDAPAGLYRMFVVVEPSNRPTLGTMLLAELRRRLVGLGAHRAWMREFEADAGFIAYLEQMGFERTNAVDIDGRVAVELMLDAPFNSIGGPP